MATSSSQSTSPPAVRNNTPLAALSVPTSPRQRAMAAAGTLQTPRIKRSTTLADDRRMERSTSLNPGSLQRSISDRPSSLHQGKAGSPRASRTPAKRPVKSSRTSPEISPEESNSVRAVGSAPASHFASETRGGRIRKVRLIYSEARQKLKELRAEVEKEQQQWERQREFVFVCGDLAELEVEEEDTRKEPPEGEGDAALELQVEGDGAEVEQPAAADPKGNEAEEDAAETPEAPFRIQRRRVQLEENAADPEGNEDEERAAETPEAPRRSPRKNRRIATGWREEKAPQRKPLFMLVATAVRQACHKVFKTQRCIDAMFELAEEMAAERRAKEIEAEEARRNAAFQKSEQALRRKSMRGSVRGSVSARASVTHVGPCASLSLEHDHPATNSETRTEPGESEGQEMHHRHRRAVIQLAGAFFSEAEQDKVDKLASTLSTAAVSLRTMNERLAELQARSVEAAEDYASLQARMAGGTGSKSMGAVKAMVEDMQRIAQRRREEELERSADADADAAQRHATECLQALLALQAQMEEAAQSMHARRASGEMPRNDDEESDEDEDLEDLGHWLAEVVNEGHQPSEHQDARKSIQESVATELPGIAGFGLSTGRNGHRRSVGFHEHCDRRKSLYDENGHRMHGIGDVSPPARSSQSMLGFNHDIAIFSRKVHGFRTAVHAVAGACYLSKNGAMKRPAPVRGQPKTSDIEQDAELRMQSLEPELPGHQSGRRSSLETTERSTIAGEPTERSTTAVEPEQGRRPSLANSEKSRRSSLVSSEGEVFHAGAGRYLQEDEGGVFHALHAAAAGRLPAAGAGRYSPKDDDAEQQETFRDAHLGEGAVFRICSLTSKSLSLGGEHAEDEQFGEEHFEQEKIGEQIAEEEIRFSRGISSEAAKNAGWDDRVVLEVKRDAELRTSEQALNEEAQDRWADEVAGSGLEEYISQRTSALESTGHMRQIDLQPFRAMLQTLQRRQKALGASAKGEGGCLEAVLANRNARARIFYGGLDEDNDNATMSMSNEPTLDAWRSESWRPGMPPKAPSMPPLAKSRPFGARLDQELLPQSRSEWGMDIGTVSSEINLSIAAALRGESPLIDSKMNDSQGGRNRPAQESRQPSKSAASPRRARDIHLTPYPTYPDSQGPDVHANQRLDGVRSETPSRQWSRGARSTLIGENRPHSSLSEVAWRSTPRPQSSLGDPLWRMKMVSVPESAPPAPNERLSPVLGAWRRLTVK